MDGRMDCRRINEFLYRFFDNELEQEIVVSFRDHIATCPDCSRQVSYTRKVLLVVRQKCSRCCAPESLRNRILGFMPHRRTLDNRQ